MDMPTQQNQPVTKSTEAILETLRGLSLEDQNHIVKEVKNCLVQQRLERAQQLNKEAEYLKIHIEQLSTI